MLASEQSLWAYSKDLLEEHLCSLKTEVNKTLELIQQSQGFFIEIPMGDALTYAAISNGSIELFLFSSEVSRWMLREFRPENINDLLILMAFNRPAKLNFQFSSFNCLVECKKHGYSQQVPDPKLKPILKDTYGQIVFIEQVSEIIRTFTDLTIDESFDLFNRLKWHQNSFNQEFRQKFLNSTQRLGYDSSVMWQIYASLVEYTAFASSKRLLESYAIPSYQWAYLQSNYPVELQQAKALLSKERANG